MSKVQPEQPGVNGAERSSISVEELDLMDDAVHHLYALAWLIESTTSEQQLDQGEVERLLYHHACILKDRWESIEPRVRYSGRSWNP